MLLILIFPPGLSNFGFLGLKCCLSLILKFGVVEVLSFLFEFLVHREKLLHQTQFYKFLEYKL
jgi:hypothetical protein